MAEGDLRKWIRAGSSEYAFFDLVEVDDSDDGHLSVASSFARDKGG